MCRCTHIVKETGNAHAHSVRAERVCENVCGGRGGAHRLVDNTIGCRGSGQDYVGSPTSATEHRHGIDFAHVLQHIT